MSMDHWELFATALRESKPSLAAHILQWETDVKAIADVLKYRNQRFDKTKFYKLCGLI